MHGANVSQPGTDWKAKVPWVNSGGRFGKGWGGIKPVLINFCLIRSFSLFFFRFYLFNACHWMCLFAIQVSESFWTCIFFQHVQLVMTKNEEILSNAGKRSRWILIQKDVKIFLSCYLDYMTVLLRNILILHKHPTENY